MNISIKTSEHYSEKLALTISGSLVILLSPEELKNLRVNDLRELKAEVEQQLHYLVYNSIRDLANK